MNTKEIKDLLKLVSELDLKEVRIKNKEFELKIRTDKDTPMQYVGAPAAIQAAPIATPPPTPVQAASESSPQPVQKEAEGGGDASNYLEIKSPMVGTFYRSPSPEKSAFVQVGDVISKGDVLCIIEAMKLFNEIESEVSGKIVKVMVEDALCL